MTKKFWNDWQQRFGETKDVVIYKNHGTEHEYGYPILCDKPHDQIVDAEWFTDSVVLQIKRYTEVGFINNRWQYKLIGTFPFLLLRTDIKSIIFNKQNLATGLGG